MTKKILVAAIDFGTTYSGWAFSFRHEYEADPTRITARQWIGNELISQKAPTCVLIKPGGKTLEAFGYDAETKYAELSMSETENHKDWYFFKRFKMMLFEKINLKRNIKLKDTCNKELPAKTVFRLAIEYLKNDLLKISDAKFTGKGIEPNEIHWVLTVPAIWNDSAKQFMRECAKEAGIGNDNLTIALEPEAASLFCRHLPVEKCKGASFSEFTAGSKYLVLDAGGGTVDITAHEVLPGGKLKEILKASGGAWGGTRVDEAYKQFLIKLFGGPVVEKFQDRHMEDYLYMFRDFEVKKRDIGPSKVEKITFRIPASLTELFTEDTGKKLKDSIPQTTFQDKITLVASDKLRVDASIVKSFFSEAVESILDHVEMLLYDSKLEGCAAILMVGGFSDSPMLQEQLRNKHKNLSIIVPYDAGLVVVKGAVIFGHNPSTIASRVCRFTYGVDYSKIFIEGEHPENKKKVIAGKTRCADLFSIHVKVGQTVNIGEAQVEQVYTPTRPDQTAMAFNVYASTRSNPKFIDEDGCFKLGNFRIEIPDTTGGLDREVEARMIFGGTEIEVETIDKTTGRKTKGKADFLG